MDRQKLQELHHDILSKSSQLDLYVSYHQSAENEPVKESSFTIVRNELRKLTNSVVAYRNELDNQLAEVERKVLQLRGLPPPGVPILDLPRPGVTYVFGSQALPTPVTIPEPGILTN